MEEYDTLAKEMIKREKEGKGFNFFHFMIDLTGGPCVYKRLSGCGSGTEYLGWSTVPGQTCNPMYQAYQKIQVTKNIHLYPVKYKWNQEPDIYAGGLADSVEKYDKIIFVGDSRTAMLRSTLKQQCSSDSLKKVGFVCKTGEGLDWMKKYGKKDFWLPLHQIRAVSYTKKITANTKYAAFGVLCLQTVEDAVQKSLRCYLLSDVSAEKLAEMFSPVSFTDETGTVPCYDTSWRVLKTLDIFFFSSAHRM